MISGTTITTVIGGAGCDSTIPFAGDGMPAINGTLSNPKGIFIDQSGNIYVSDTLNQRVRMVNVSTGIINTIAGNGIADFTGDGGPATNASLYNPIGVAVDASGNVFIADSSNNRIRKVDGTTGVISTFAGSGTTSGYSGDGGAATAASLYNPNGVVVDLGNGIVYISDTGNDRIRSVGTDNTITTIAGDGYNHLGDDNVKATKASF